MIGGSDGLASNPQSWSDTRVPGPGDTIGRPARDRARECLRGRLLSDAEVTETPGQGSDQPSPALLMGLAGVPTGVAGQLLAEHGLSPELARVRAVEARLGEGRPAGECAVGQGPTGSISADSYAIYDRGQRLVFQGKVHSRLNAH